jgi:hypothetical protein
VLIHGQRWVSNDELAHARRLAWELAEVLQAIDRRAPREVAQQTIDALVGARRAHEALGVLWEAVQARTPTNGRERP